MSGIATDPLYLDVTLAARSSMHEALPTTHVAFIFMISGQLSLPAGTRDNYIETKNSSSSTMKGTVQGFNIDEKHKHRRHAKVHFLGTKNDW